MADLFGYDAAYPPPISSYGPNDVLISVYIVGRYAYSKAYCDQARAAGIGLAWNYELGESELVTAGFSGGQDIARRAIAAAEALGAKPNAGEGIYYSIDTNVNQADYANVGHTIDGIMSVAGDRYCTHVYCEDSLIDYLVKTRLKPGCGHWLAGATAWGEYFHPDDPNVALVQHMQSQIPGTDKNLITHPEAVHAQWPANSPYATGDEDVALDDEKYPSPVPGDNGKLVSVAELVQWTVAELVALDRDLRGDLKNKQKQLDTLTAQLADFPQFDADARGDLHNKQVEIDQLVATVGTLQAQVAQITGGGADPSEVADAVLKSLLSKLTAQ